MDAVADRVRRPARRGRRRLRARGGGGPRTGTLELARLHNAYSGGPAGMLLTPAMRADLGAGIRALDFYPTATGYAG